MKGQKKKTYIFEAEGIFIVYVDMVQRGVEVKGKKQMRKLFTTTPHMFIYAEDG